MFMSVVIGFIVAVLMVLMDHSFNGRSLFKARSKKKAKSKDKVKVTKRTVKTKDGGEEAEVIEVEDNDEDEEDPARLTFSEFWDSDVWTIAIGVGACVAVCRYVLVALPQIAFLPVVAWLLMIAAVIFVTRWCAGRINKGSEFLWYFIILVMINTVANLAVQRMINMFNTGLLKTIVDIILPVIETLSIGSVLVGLFRRNKKHGAETAARIISIVLAVLCVISSVFSYGVSINDFRNIRNDVAVFRDHLGDGLKFGTNALTGNSSAFVESPAQTALTQIPAAEPLPTGFAGQSTYASNPNIAFWNSVAASYPTTVRDMSDSPKYGYQGGYPTFTDVNGVQHWYSFYNAWLQTDNDNNNNFNFGPSPFDSQWTAKDYDQEFRVRMINDPALGVGDMAWFDMVLGTYYSETYFDGNANKWAEQINQLKQTYMDDQEAYYRNLGAFFRFLDAAVSVEVREFTGIEDQMYMNPYTVDNAPYVVVFATDQRQGHFLVYTFDIKGTKVSVCYRIECGFQPCNVVKMMNDVVEARGYGDNPGSDPTPPGPDPSPTPPGPSPTPPDPTPTVPQKDPTQGTPVGRNDTPGPGPNTNNGVGAQTSSADQSTNSGSMTLPEYHETMQDLADTNANQSVGGDANMPSAPPPAASTHVDSNADAGTGHGGADTPTPVSEPVHVEAPSGQTETIDNTPSDPAGEWGGPPD